MYLTILYNATQKQSIFTSSCFTATSNFHVFFLNFKHHLAYQNCQGENRGTLDEAPDDHVQRDRQQ